MTDVERLIESIYGTVAVPQTWTDVLVELKDYVGVRYMSLGCAAAGEDGKHYSVSAFDDTVDIELLRAFLEEHAGDNPVLDAMTAATGGDWTQVVTGRESMDWNASEITPAWDDYFQRADVADVGSLVLHEPDGPRPTLGCGASRTGVAIDPWQRAKLQALAHHLRLAVRLRYRTAPDLGAAPHVLAAMDHMATGCILLDAQGCMLHVNPPALVHLHNGGRMRTAGGRLFAASPQADGQLQEVLRRACRAGFRSGGEVRLTQPPGLPLTAMITPLGGDNPLTETISGARAAVYLLDADAPVAGDLSRRRLQRMFGFTAAEADIAAALMTGDGPDDIALARGRSVQTVRVQVKAILAKAGVRRTGELQALRGLLSGPIGQ